MEKLLNSLRDIFFTKIVGDITLYTIISVMFKFVLVFIALYYIHMIVKIIILDIKAIDYSKKRKIYYIIYGRENEIKKRYNLESLNKFGRSITNDVILNSKLVSKEHALIIETKGIFYLSDNDSSNGTYLNGVLIDENIELLVGDVIKIGDFIIEFRDELIYDKKDDSDGYQL